ncbi:MAG TPA: M48 family metallopeptidase [Abditibacteriaceae bacterium]|jgi:predicted Zn-dependent protease
MKNRFLLVLALFLSVCAASPQTAHAGLFSISPDKERKMGADAAKQIESQARIVRGPVADWVEAIGSRLAATSDKEFKYSFKVIDSPEVNAFALPGGYIYVYTGLRKVAQTDDELAAVLAHEITHSEKHHYAQQYKKASKRGLLFGVGAAIAGLPNLAQQALGILDFSMTQKYGRSHESEADRLGMERMARAGFNPEGMVSLLTKLAAENGSSSRIDQWMSDHPEGKKRAAAAELQTKEIRALQAQNAPTVKPVFPTWSLESLRGESVPSEAVSKPVVP